MKYKEPAEFKRKADYYEYLASVSPCNNSARLIASRLMRIGAGYTVEKAVCTPKITKPLSSHPYKQQYQIK